MVLQTACSSAGSASEQLMDGPSFQDTFLQANARPEFIIVEFADVLRDLIRALAATDDSRALHNASEKMKFCAELMSRCPDPMSWYALFNGAISAIKGEIPDDQERRGYIDAARRGTKYLVEVSSVDGFAAARSSKAYAAFLQAVEWAEEASWRASRTL